MSMGLLEFTPPRGWRKQWARLLCRLRGHLPPTEYVQRLQVTSTTAHRWRVSRCPRCGRVGKTERIGKRTAQVLTPGRSRKRRHGRR